MIRDLRLCDNPHKTKSSMRILRDLAIGVGFVAVAAGQAWAQSPSSPQAKAQAAAPPPLVLVGGTIVDVTEWGHSAKDLEDGVVVIRDGHITDVGTRYAITIPKNARVIDCTGKYIIPGLVDGFAGMNSQGQASANLYMGVTTIVASSDDRRGAVDAGANPSPHVYMVDSVGTTDDWSSLARRPEWAAKLK